MVDCTCLSFWPLTLNLLCPTPTRDSTIHNLSLACAPLPVRTSEDQESEQRRQKNTPCPVLSIRSQKTLQKVMKGQSARGTLIIIQMQYSRENAGILKTANLFCILTCNWKAVSSSVPPLTWFIILQAGMGHLQTLPQAAVGLRVRQ